MVNTAYINIWGARVGAVSWNSEKGFASFEFDSGFQKKRWNLSPIKLPVDSPKGRIFSFSELSKTKTFRGLPGLLADTLPDKYGNALINTWLSRHGRPADDMNPIEQLCFIGKRGMGALEFEPTLVKEPQNEEVIEIRELVQIADQILSGKTNFHTKLNPEDEKAIVDILKIGTSAGGARAKALISYNPVTEEVYSGQGDVKPGHEHWLIKFDGVHDAQFGTSSGYGRVEMAYYLMATEAGIDMMECRILEENGRAHFMTKRFDRDPTEGKIHMQSFCGLTHYDFNEVGLNSYEQLFETMRILRLSYPEAEQMFRRMVLNVLARNCDDHTKNFAFLMDKNGKWKLAPAYDVCHAFRPDSPWVSQQSLSVNGKRRGIGLDDLLSVGQQMNIKRAKPIVEQVKNVVKKWPEFAEKTLVEPILRDAILSTFPEF